MVPTPVADAARLVDLDRHPILDLDGAAGSELVDRARTQLAEGGACELPGFVRPGAVARMVEDARSWAPRAHWSAGRSTPYLEIPESHWPEDHPRRMFDPFSVGAVAYDRIPADAPLRELYEWEAMNDFLAAVLELPRVHRYDDPLGALNVAVMGSGDCLEWHFDQTDFVVSLALQGSRGGGHFEYAPRIRSAGDERYDDVRRVLEGRSERVRRLPMRPGTLLLFQGRYSIHRVTEVRGDLPRLVALMGYDSEPGTCATELLQKVRYGRSKRPGE